MLSLRNFLLELFIAIFIFVPMASAETVTVEAEGEYTFGDGVEENPITAKEIARKKALRSASEQVAVYVESFSKMENFKLTSDQIFTISAAVMKVIEEDFEYQTISQKAIKIVYFVKAEVDSSNIDLKELIEDRKNLNKNSQLEKQVKSQQDEIARLKKKIEKLNSNKDNNSKKNEPSPNERFVKLVNDDTYNYYFDKKVFYRKKIPNSNDEYMLDVWVRMIERSTNISNALNDVEVLQNSSYYLEHYYLRPKTKQIQFLGEFKVVGDVSDTFSERIYDHKNWENLIQGSIESIIYYTIMQEVGENFF